MTILTTPAEVVLAPSTPADITTELNNTLVSVAAAGGGTVSLKPATYTALGKIWLLPYVHLDLKGSTINGAGVGSGILFETATLVGGVPTSNVGTPDGSRLVACSSVRDGVIKNSGRAFNLFNYLDNCELCDLHFVDCTYNVYADNCYYGRFINLFSRGTAGGAANAAFYFANFANVCEIQSVFCQGRLMGFEFSGIVNALSLRTCSVEDGTTGMKFSGSVGAVSIDSCYFESLTGTGIDMSAATNKLNITVANSFFYNLHKGIAGKQLISGRIGPGNNFDTISGNYIEILDDFDSYVEVHLPVAVYSSANPLTQLPALNPKFSVGAKCKVIAPEVAYNNATGLPIARENGSIGRVVDLPYTGTSGNVQGGIAFSNIMKSGSSPSITVSVQTGISFEAYVIGVFKVVIADYDGSYTFQGRFFGSSAFLDAAPVGKTLTINNVGGYCQFVFANFTHPSGASAVSVEGVIRIA